MANKYSNNPIPNLDADWGLDTLNGLPYSGRAVQDFIKGILRGIKASIGYVHWYRDEDRNNYRFWGFETKDAYDTYITDPEEYADLLLVDEPLPIPVISGDSYGTYLFSTVNQTADIVVTNQKFEVDLRFHAVRITAGERTNMGSKGTLTVQYSLDNGASWVTSAVINGAINSTDITDTTTYTKFDVGPYLHKGYRQLVRIRGSFNYTDESGVERTGYSTWVLVGNSITYTELSLKCDQNWNNALQASAIRNVGFPISYLVQGVVEKTIHIEIQGDTVCSVSYPLSIADNGVSVHFDVSDASNVYKIFTHGVHTVTAWLSCSNGLGGTIESSRAVNNFMVIDPATAANPLAPYIMLQGLKSRVGNYVQTTLCEYAVFNPVMNGSEIVPGDEPIDITFYLTSYTDNFPSGNYTEYFESGALVTPNVKYTLGTTIEIESDSTQDIITYFRVWRTDGINRSDLLFDSMGVSFIQLEVDNSDSFSPTLGKTFLINPKVRNNAELNPKRILNFAMNNSEVESTWNGFDMISDGWVTSDDGVKVLRVLAGERLNIRFNPFSQFITAPDSAMTLEFDLAVRNVTNEDDPILSILEMVAGNPRGIEIRPMEGNIFVKSDTEVSETNFRFCEDKRTHIVINIHNAISPNVNGDGLPYPTNPNPSSTIALARVFINGNIEREVPFNIRANDEFCTNEMSNGGIFIGQDGADIDIYSIGCYANRQLSAQDIVKNYISTLPTSEEKRSVRAQNDIMSGGLVDVEKVKALGKRVLIMHGLEPYHERNTVASVWWEIFQYNDDGTLNPDLSGTICKATGMAPKRQGSTANTYFYSNIQTKVDDGGTIQVALADFHSSIQVSEPYTSNGGTFVDILGGNLGKNEPVMTSAQAKPYPFANGMVSVPDGWIDGNGKYRGMGFMITEGTPLATKLVLKVNYASSMQSHLCAGTRLYNDLHTKVVGKNSLQEAVPTARVSKYTEPVYFFTQSGNSSPVYRGGGNFGAGKMDKPTWGYVKSLHPMFTMIEGSDNNYPLTDMRVPFITDSRCPEAVTYDAEEEGYFYDGLQSLDFDAGTTDNNGVPTLEITSRLAETWNFIYLHSTMIKHYVGSFKSFQSSSEASNTNFKFWCTDGADAYKLKRYNFVTSSWVDAGLWNGSGYDVVNIKMDGMTKPTYDASTNKANYGELNKEIIAAIAAHAKRYIGFYFNVSSLQFHYAFQNHFMAGTDNCSKNTYFVLDPQIKSVTIEGETRYCYLFELHQDDVDTIFITDNNGRSTKPYYIDRMHPYDDKDVNRQTSCYEGMYNALFNLCESMWEGSRELQGMMKSVFTAMSSLVTESDNAKGYTSSIWGCLEKYFFSIQHYYSQMAYNEQARIRYEWPALLGFVSSGSGARNIKPITQSMGSQLEAETQFMLRRVVLMASYAAWGQLHDGGKQYNIGLADVTDAFSMQVFHLPNTDSSNNNYTLNVVPHQYIYPTGMLGQTSIDPHVRVAPGHSYALNIGNTGSNDTGISVLGANYYRSFGNVGDLSVSPNISFTVRGKRLTEFVAEPAVLYEEDGKTVGAFRPMQLDIKASHIKRINLNGSGISGVLDMRNLTRLESFDIRGTYIYDIDIPASEILTEMHLSDNLIGLRIADLPNLSILDLGNCSSLESLQLLQTNGVDSYGIVSVCYSNNAPLNNTRIVGVDWSNANVAIVNYLANVGVSNLNGIIRINEPYSTSSVVSADMKRTYIAKWGAVDDAANSLYITYNIRTTDSAKIICDAYFRHTGTYQAYIQPISRNSNDYIGEEWSVSTNSFGVTVDANTGVITVPRISNTEIYCTLTARFLRAGSSPLVLTKRVGIYDRPCTPGDYVFYDGSYSDDYDGSKKVIGICFYVNPDDRSDRRMVALEPATSHVWGIQDFNINLADAPNYPPTDKKDTPVANIDIGGDLVNSGGSIYIYEDKIVGTGEQGEVTDTDGFLIYDNLTCFGSKELVVVRDKIDELLSPPIGQSGVYAYPSWFVDRVVQIIESDGHSLNDKIPIGQFNTYLIIAHRNLILSDSNVNLPIPMATPQYTEKQMLTEYISQVISQHSSEGSNRSNRYPQYYYPAASYAYCYEPSVPAGVELADRFKAHHWYLPSGGELIRFIWYVSKGYSASTDYAVFAKAYNDGVITGFNKSAHSSSELGSVSAFSLVIDNNNNMYYSVHTGSATGSTKSDSRDIYAVTTF